MRPFGGFIAVLGLTAAVALLGCGSEAGGSGTGEIKTLAKIDVNLPAPPKPPAYKYPKTHSDGAIGCEEILRNPEEYLEKEVKVKGHVVWKSVCDCPGGKPSKTCSCAMSHLYIADAPDETRIRLLVADFIGEEYDEIEEGMHVNVYGIFDRTSRVGFTSKLGLIQFNRLEDLATGEIITGLEEGMPGMPPPGMPTPDKAPPPGM